MKRREWIKTREREVGVSLEGCPSQTAIAESEEQFPTGTIWKKNKDTQRCFRLLLQRGDEQVILFQCVIGICPHAT